VEQLADAQQKYGSARRERGDAWPGTPGSPVRVVAGGEAPDRDAGARGGAHPAAVERALAAMRGPLDRPLSLATLAEITGLSPFHFARTFRQATGSPPGQFLAALRLERAKRLLLTTDLPVTEICFAVGYDSLGTFTTRFTQLVGLPPSRVRRLPDLLAEAVARLPGDGLAPVGADAAPGVTGRVAPSAGADALIFVGLFPGAIAQGRPVAGTVLAGPGPFRLPAPPDGRYHLLAAALPHPRDPLACLLPGAALRVGRAAGMVLVRGGRVSGPTDIALRPPQPTDPPTLVALPALLLNFCPWFRTARAAGA
jgi:AraC-like DNA-binding protein